MRFRTIFVHFVLYGALLFLLAVTAQAATRNPAYSLVRFFAAGPSLAIDFSATASPGATVTVPVVFNSNGNNVGAISLSIEYDQRCLQYVSSTYQPGFEPFFTSDTSSGAIGELNRAFLALTGLPATLDPLVVVQFLVSSDANTCPPGTTTSLRFAPDQLPTFGAIDGSPLTSGAITNGSITVDVTPTATPTVPTATPTVPTATPTVPTATPTVPTATPTVPTATPTVPTATSTVPTATSTVPTATSTAPTATSTVPTATSTAPTATSTVPTATSTAPTATSTVPTATSTVPTATSTATPTVTATPSITPTGTLPTATPTNTATPTPLVATVTRTPTATPTLIGTTPASIVQSFVAELTNDDPPMVRLIWQTSLEVDSAGFYIYRKRSDSSGDFIPLTGLIPAEGAPGVYEYRDEDVEVGAEYSYLLVEKKADGTLVTYPALIQRIVIVSGTANHALWLPLVVRPAE